MKPAPETNYAALFAILCAVFTVGPLLAQLTHGGQALGAMLAIALFFAATGLSRNRMVRNAVRVFVVVAAVASAAAAYTNNTPARIAAETVLFVIFAWSMWRIIQSVLSASRVDTQHVLGALCVYLTAGVLWSLLFRMASDVDANAFTGVEGVTDLFYFSLVTLTSLGYGDIVPVSPFARSLATAEALFGQIYMAALVGWLIGMRTQTGEAS